MRETEITLCGNCGKEMEQYKTARKDLYCSKECRSIVQSERVKGKKFGTWEEMYGEKKAKEMRENHSLLKKGIKLGTYKEQHGEDKAKEIIDKKVNSFKETSLNKIPIGTIHISGDTEVIKIIEDDKIIWKPLYVYRMEEKIGGLIPKKHDVHHLDHNRMHNNLENLVIWTKEEHGRYHGSHKSDDSLLKMSKAQSGGNNPKAKKVVQVETGKIFGCKNDVHELVGERGSSQMKRALDKAILENTKFGDYHYKFCKEVKQNVLQTVR